MRLPSTKPTLADSITWAISDLESCWTKYLSARRQYVRAYSAAHRAKGMDKVEANKKWEASHVVYTDARSEFKEAHTTYKSIFRSMDQGKQL